MGIFRFYHNSKSVSIVIGPLYTHELETSIKKVVKLLQNGEYHTELILLKCNKPLPKSSKLQSLNVFLDSEGILRVGGRLRLQQTLKFEQKHPMLIPKNHHFTSLIIRHFHRVNFHAGQGIYIYNVTVNGDRYRAMITNFFIPELNNHDVQELWFQQDGATCHTARATIDLLKDTFGDRLISRFGPVNWPPRSYDLTPLDYFFVGLYKVIGLCGEATNA
ncbi:uncharacterized protein TNCV_80581 [Trichonephila clavipes]|nr:uncharacterized protein TNCV_80581 [Trichonephila clavipes]